MCTCYSELNRINGIKVSRNFCLYQYIITIIKTIKFEGSSVICYCCTSYFYIRIFMCVDILSNSIALMVFYFSGSFAGFRKLISSIFLVKLKCRALQRPSVRIYLIYNCLVGKYDNCIFRCFSFFAVICAVGVVAEFQFYSVYVTYLADGSACTKLCFEVNCNIFIS